MIRTSFSARWGAALLVVAAAITGCSQNEPDVAMRAGSFSVSTNDLERDLSGWSEAIAAAQPTAPAVPTPAPTAFSGAQTAEYLQLKLFGEVFRAESSERKLVLPAADSSEVVRTMQLTFPGAEAFPTAAAAQQVIDKAPKALVDDLREAARIQVALTRVGAASTETATKVDFAIKIDDLTIGIDRLKQDLDAWSEAIAEAQATGGAAPAVTPFTEAQTAEYLQGRLFGEAFRAEIAARKVTLPAATVPEVIQTMQQIFPGAETLQALGPEAAQAAIDKAPKALVDELRETARVQVALNSAVEQLAKTPRETYDANPDQFAETCVKHILVASEDEVKAMRAELVQSGAAATGAKFTELAKAKSTDPGSGANGGELGCGPTSQYVPEFGAAASSLEINELSEPIQTQFGWHLLVVTKRTTIAFDKVDVAQLTTLAQQKAGEELTTSLLKRLREAKVTLNPVYGTVIEPTTPDEPRRIGPPEALVAKRTPILFDVINAEAVSTNPALGAQLELRNALLRRLRDADVVVNPRFGVLVEPANDSAPLQIGQPAAIGGGTTGTTVAAGAAVIGG